MSKLDGETGFEKLAVVLKNNLYNFLYIIIVIAVVGGVLMFFRYKAHEREITARLSLEQGKEHMRENKLEDAYVEFQKVISEYSGTAVYEEALLYRGMHAINSGEHEKALKYFQNYADEFPAGRFLPKAYSEIAFIYEESRDYSEALRLYSLIFKEFPGSYLAPKSMMDAARCLEVLGRGEEASELYESLTILYPWSAFFETALMRLQDL